MNLAKALALLLIVSCQLIVYAADFPFNRKDIEAINALLSDGKQAEAQYLVEAALQNTPSDKVLLYVAGALTRTRFETTTSTELFQRCLAQGADPYIDSICKVIIQLDARQHPDYNLHSLRELAKAHPGDILLQWMMAVQCRTYNLNEEGIAIYQAMLKSWAVGPALVHQTCANLYDEVGKSAEALKHRQITIALEKAPWSYQGLGNTYSSLGRFSEADEAFKTGYEMNKNSTSCLVAWANSYNLRGNPTQGREMAEKALLINKNSYWGRLYLADALVALKQKDKALDIYNSLYSENPGDKWVRKKIQSLSPPNQ